jgi:plasmid stability protein
VDDVIAIELEEEVIALLRERAKRNGRSLDEEVNAILAEASRKDDGVGFV